MAVELFANDGAAVVSSGGTTAPAAGTIETWTLASSTLPAVSQSAEPPTCCYVADTAPGATETEKVLVIDITGAAATVVRGADGTAPVAHTAGFTVAQVATRGTFVGLQTAWANVLDPQFSGGADPTGGSDSWAAIQAALLSFGTLSAWNQGQGGVVNVPPGMYKISKTLIIPSGVTLQGSGWGSQITLLNNSNCDMIQAATYQSASQAAILGVSASSIGLNAFWAGVRDMALHGDSFHVTIPGYRHGINVTTSPGLTAAGADPDFDPMFVVENVRIEAVTGDCYYHNGRSGAFLQRVWGAYSNGNAFSPSFDTTLIDCLAEGTNCGFYMDHGSDVAAGCKSYNNNDNTWVAATAYTPGSVVISAGTMYFCILAVSGSTVPSSDGTHWIALTVADGAWVSGTAYSPGATVTFSGQTYICIAAVSGSTSPSSDTAHWAAPTPAWVSGTAYSAGQAVSSSGTLYYCLAAVSGSTVPASDPAHWTGMTSATSPQAAGYGFYWDSNCAEQSWAAVDDQENSTGGYYFKGPNTGAISVDGTSAAVNFSNGQPSHNAANPNHYACVTFDGVSNVNFRLSSTAQGGGSGVICTSLNSPGPNTLIATTDGTEAALFSGGAPGFALINGQFQSPITGQASVTSGVVALTFASTLNINAALGNHFRVTLTGNATVAAPTGLTDGQKITLELIQDATGSRTLSWNAAFDFGTAGAPTLTATPSKRDLVGFVYSSSAAKWLFAGMQAGF